MKLNKKIISCLLALAIVMTALPMTLVTSAADTNGIKATIYRMPRSYASIIGEDSYGGSVSFENNHKFEASIETLLANSKLDTEEDLTAFPVVTDKGDNYIKKWTGTMTAKETATYTVVGRKIDNGFAMKVNDVLVYEYWGASHWFDGGEDRLPSDKGTISVEEGKTYNIEMYYLELGGGDNLKIQVATDANDVATEKAMDDAFTFNIKEQLYRILSGNLSDIIGIGNGADGEGKGGNSAQCEEANAKYAESIDAVKALTTIKGETVVVGKIAEPIVDEENYLISYDGYLVPKKSGTYTFGALRVDNCFYMEIEDQVVYEFWAGRTWNDTLGNTYPTGIELEAGKAYKFEAVFLEIDGGQDLRLVASINDDKWSRSVDELFTYYTEEPSEITQVEEEKAPFVLPATNDKVIADVQFVQGTDNVIVGMDNSTIRFNSSAVLSQVNESMTIEMIVKLDSFWNHGVLMSIGDSDAAGKHVVMGFMEDGCVKVNDAHHNEASAKLPLNEWVTVKFEIGNDSIKAYLNNTLVTEDKGVDVASLAGTEMNFGHRTVDAWGDGGLKGAVAQVRITTPQVVATSGAQMRYEGTYGLRFKGAVNTEAAENATYGMVIMPKDMLEDDYSDLTVDNENVLNIVAGKTIGTNGDYTEYTGVVVGIPEGSFDRELVAKAYVTIDGQTTYAEAQVRSYAQVAEAVYETENVDPAIKDEIAKLFGEEIVAGWANN